MSDLDAMVRQFLTGERNAVGDQWGGKFVVEALAAELAECRAQLEKAVAERDTWFGRGVAMLSLLPGDTIAGDLQKAADEFALMRARAQAAEAAIARVRACQRYGERFDEERVEWRVVPTSDGDYFLATDILAAIDAGGGSA